MTSFRQVKFFLHTSPELCPSKVASCRNCLLQGGCGDRQALILLAERTNKKNGFHFLQTVWRLLKTPNIWPPSFHYWSHSKSAKTRGVFGMVSSWNSKSSKPDNCSWCSAVRSCPFDSGVGFSSSPTWVFAPTTQVVVPGSKKEPQYKQYKYKEFLFCFVCFF